MEKHRPRTFVNPTLKSVQTRSLDMRSRFTSLRGYGREDLETLNESTAAVVGLGATGSVIAEHLARHGVNLTVIDRDYLEENDLYSSNLYTAEDVEKGLPKAVAVEEKLSEFTEVDGEVISLDSGNVGLLEDADIVMDGTDNLETRFLIDEYCSREDIPWIYTAAVGDSGCSMMFEAECFSCVFDRVGAGSLETCETAGILREVASIAASRSSMKAVRYLSGREVEEHLDILPSGRRLRVESGGCEVCRGESYPELESERITARVCGEGKFQLEREVTEQAFERLKDAGELKADNDYLTKAEIDGREFTLFSSGRAIIEARDRDQAEQRFSELLG